MSEYLNREGKPLSYDVVMRNPNRLMTKLATTGMSLLVAGLTWALLGETIINQIHAAFPQVFR